jgi:ADP-heptose:LPS heptosyltransferase
LKLLLLRLSAIGDVIHTLPAAAALRAAGHELSWLVEPAARSLICEKLARVVSVPSARHFRPAAAREAVRTLRASRFDVALDFQGLWKSAAWARLSGARRKVGYDRASRREAASALLLGERMALPEGIAHVIDKNLALLRTVGVEAVGQRSFPLPAGDVPRVEQGLAELGLLDQPFALLSPGGGWESKTWPAARFGGLADRLRELGLRSLVAWGPGEETLADSVVFASRGAGVRCFPSSLLDFAELARRAAVVVAADTGPLHLACAVGAPVVGLYGPTDPARNGPFSPKDEVVRRVPPCAPCHRRHCFRHSGVMAQIRVEDVAAAVARRREAALEG